LADSAQRLLKRHQDLLAVQWTARTVWQEIADFCIPYKAVITTQRAEGQKKTGRLFDATAPHALSLLAASLHASMTPSTQPWLSLKMRQEALNAIKEVQDWLEDCARRMHRAFRQSTFAQSVHELYLDLAAFGTGALFVEEKPITQAGVFGGFRFHVPAIGTYVIAEDADGQADTLFRTFKLSVRAAYAKWKEAIGPDLLERLKQKPDDPVEILHAVYPRLDRKYDGETGQAKRGSKNMPWASCYVAVPFKHKIEEGGFEEFPFMVPRWAKTSGETYGTSPSHTALPDVATLNATKEFILKAAPMQIWPPSLERDDSIVGDLDTTPMGRNVVNGAGPIGEQLMFMDTRQRPDMAQMVLAELRQGIHAIYFTDQLVLREKPDMTATEVLALQEQMQRLLGPTTGRLESEFLNPLVQRTFALMARAGAFLRLPETLQAVTRTGQADLDIEYEGPLARAQRTIELAAQDRVVGFVTALAQGKAQFPGAEWDLLKTDKMIRDRADITGLPSDNLEAQEQVDAMRADRQTAQENQAKLATMTQMAEAAGKVSPFMKQAQEMAGAGAQNGKGRAA